MTITCQSCQRQRKHQAKGYCASCYQRYRLENQPVMECRRCKRERHLYAKGYCASCCNCVRDGRPLKNRLTHVTCDVCRRLELCRSFGGRGRFCERCYRYKVTHRTLPYTNWWTKYLSYERATAWAQGISEEQRQTLPLRLQELITLQANGMNLQQIGARFGVSREYVRQLRVKAQQLTA